MCGGTGLNVVESNLAVKLKVPLLSFPFTIASAVFFTFFPPFLLASSRDWKLNGDSVYSSVQLRL